ncbi:MAG: hypothetical protein JO251_08360 [Verrucomicrobia bacterium]|nr:hypothetical protein [Verrucomicrobiota bacterium]
MWDGTTYLFEGEYVLLCEGLADKAFFRELARRQRLPNFDFPWPPAPEDKAPEAAKKLFGKEAFGKMLAALDGLFDLFPERLTQIKAILIAADTAEDGASTFGRIRNQILKIPNFGIPTAIGQPAASQHGRPPVGVLLVPGDGRPGGLETLCVDAFREKHSQVCRCMEDYLRCHPIDLSDWTPESQDKARLQCLIAATNRDDPNKTLRWAFSSSSGSPIIDIAAHSFDAVAQALTNFCEATGARPMTTA